MELAHVRFGSKADICAAKDHVRFTLNSDRESEIPQKVMSALPPKADMCSANMSALPPKADMCSANSNVRFGPIADIGQVYSITSSAREISVAGTVMPRIRAVWMLMTSSNLVACTTGKSSGLAPLRTRPA